MNLKAKNGFSEIDQKLQNVREMIEPKNNPKNNVKDIKSDIFYLIDKYFSQKRKEFIPGKTRITLNVPSYGPEEVKESVDSLLSSWLTMGKKVAQFEQMFADYLGARYASMVNSGSSANLLALSVLSSQSLTRRLNRGDEVIIPATTWITTFFPIHNLNMTPVIVDVDAKTFNIDPEKIEEAITEKTKAIMPIHMLGNPCDMKLIMEIAEKHGLFVIEDACEAHGAEINGKKVGTFGDLSTFSFFFTHHISTIEGGMVVTNNEEYAELAKSMRVFGWVRGLKREEEIARQYKQIDRRFLFANLGYNIRPTEIQGAFGIHQIKKLEKFISVRLENAKYLNKTFEEFSDYLILQQDRPNARHVWFTYPITVRPNPFFTRDDMVEFLENKNIETRPIQAANVTKQPSIKFVPHRVSGDLVNADFIMKNSFFFGNHQGIGEEERDYIIETVSDFMRSKI